MSVYTLLQYNALCEAISLGATKVKYADKEVEYRSLSEMLKLKVIMENDLGLKSQGQNRRAYAEFNRGFE